MNFSIRVRWALFWVFALVVLALLFTEHRAHAWGLGVHALLLAICLVLLVVLIRLDGPAGSERDR